MGFMNGARVHDFGLMGLGLEFTDQVIVIYAGRLGGLRVKAFRAQHARVFWQNKLFSEILHEIGNFFLQGMPPHGPSMILPSL